MLQDIISLLGIGNPQLSLAWQDDDRQSEAGGSPMRLIGRPGREWLAPASGLLNRGFSNRLSMPDGSLPAGDTWVLTLHTHVHLRLACLYGRVLEARTAGIARVQRPVPRYFAFHDTTPVAGGSGAGNRSPGERLGIAGGSVSVHDGAGRPIDALATACAFTVLMTNFPALIAKDFTSDTAPSVPSSPLGQMVAGIAGTEVRVRLATLFGKPYTHGAARLTNLTAIDAPAGLYRISNLGQPVAMISPPPDINERTVLGPATFGTLGISFSPSPLGALAPIGSLKRDYLSLFGDDLNAHLLGDEPKTAPFNTADFQVPTYHNENVTLLTNGNRVTARAGQILTGAAGLSLVVSPVIAGDFSVAASPEGSEWPAFPAGGDGGIAGRLENLVLSAHFLGAPADPRDVFLSIEIPETSPGSPQLSPGTAIRIYNRKFLADAREGRGNGAGGVLSGSRTVGFVLKNPFEIRQGDPLLVNPHLSFDLIAVNRTGRKRSFGLIGTPVGGARAMNPAETALADRGANLFDEALERGIASAGLLGLPAPRLNGIGSITDIESAVNVALDLGDESQPRSAPRLPIMTRNETVVAGLDAAGVWSSVLSSLWLRRDSRSSFHRLGSPGSPGGEEFFGAGVATSGGLLAYDLARATFRRTRDLASRLSNLESDSRWSPPGAPAPAGTFSVALLQDIAPGADSPNLKLIPDAVFDTLPSDWAELVGRIDALIPEGLPANARVRQAVRDLAGSAKGNLLYSEFRRDVVTSRFGRRDSRALLRWALGEARDLIYIESSAFSFTDYKPDDPADPENANDPANAEQDLVTLISEQMTAKPGLKVLIAVSKEFLAGKGYETFAARAYARRVLALEKLQAVDPERVTLFHPIGFPGRPIRLMHNIVIVDDIWAFIGSGSFTRRGFLFDGNLSVACFDREIESGRSKSIRNFRRQLLEDHLGTNPMPGIAPAVFPHPNRSRVSDLHEAYFAARDMLDQGGSGLIQPVWGGSVTGQRPIESRDFPHRDIADPDGLTYPSTLAALLQIFLGLNDAEA